MRNVNCNCEMPYCVYLDWLEDEGWDATEMRLSDPDEVATGLGSRDGTPDFEQCGHGDGWGSGWGMGYGYEPPSGDGIDVFAIWGDGCGNGFIV